MRATLPFSRAIKLTSRRNQRIDHKDCPWRVAGAHISGAARDNELEDRTSSPISQLGFLSDSRTSALVDSDGNVVWYCPQRFDGPSVFAQLLDDAAGGWRLAPVGAAKTARRYLGESLILVTRHQQGSGV